MCEVAQARYEALKEHIEVRKGSEEELRLICAEQRGTIEGYKREVRRLEVERNGAVGRHEAEREEFDRERREMEAELARAREASGTHNRYAEQYDAVRAELASARAELAAAQDEHRVVGAVGHRWALTSRTRPDASRGTRGTPTCGPARLCAGTAATTAAPGPRTMAPAAAR